MKAKVLRLGRAVRRIWAAIAAIATLLGAGVIQFKLAEWDISRQAVQRWWPVVIGALALLLFTYAAVFEVWLPLARKRSALKELRQHVSVATLLAHYRNRSEEIG